VKAISTPGTVVVLDELSRAHPDAANILMPVLDNQKYLRLDEAGGNVVRVADGVSFIATANIGNEYTSTKIMDRALMNRFSVKIEMDPLSADEEFNLLKTKFDIQDSDLLETLRHIVDIAEHTRKALKQEDAQLSNFLSTRDTMEMAELLTDGFDLLEIAENVIYPNFEQEGGADSERTYVKQVVQKYVVNVNLPKTLFKQVPFKKPSNTALPPTTGTSVPTSQVPF
jgi:MoxR-like ATPase